MNVIVVCQGFGTTDAYFKSTCLFIIDELRRVFPVEPKGIKLIFESSKEINSDEVRICVDDTKTEEEVKYLAVIKESIIKLNRFEEQPLPDVILA
jgi:hypothetical protein